MSVVLVGGKCVGVVGRWGGSGVEMCGREEIVEGGGEE